MEEYFKDFDNWNIEKKNVDKKSINRNLYFHTKEIWWCSTGVNIGSEADGKNNNFERPFLIIKKFNNAMLWGIPLTTKNKEDKNHYRLSKNKYNNSIAVLSQLKIISSKRLLRKIGLISEEDFNNILNAIINILKVESPLSGAFSEAEATSNLIIDQEK